MATIASLVVQIGADTADLKRNVEKMDSTLSGIGSVATTLGKTLAGAFTIGAITSFVTDLVESASHIADLAAKTGVSTDAIQRWEYAVKLSGGTIDQVSKSVLFMSKTLATGGDSAVAALNKAGLSFKDIKGMAPEQAFDEITEAIRGIKDPMEQAQVTMALFGKTGVEMLPAIRDGMKEVGDQATIMSSDTIEAFDMLGDAWTTTSQWFKAQAAEWVTKPFREWKDLIDAIKQDLSGLPAIAAGIETPDLFKNPESTIGATGKALEDMLKASQDVNKETEESVRKADAYQTKIQALADTFTGKDLQGKVNDLAAAIKLAGGESKIGEFQFAALAKQAAELRDNGAKLTPVLHDMAMGFDILQFNAKLVQLNAQPISKTIGDIGKATIAAKPDIIAFNDKLSDMIALAQASGGPASLTSIRELGTAIKELPAPPISEWHAFKENAKTVLEGVEYDVATSVVSLIGHWSHWKEKSKEIWESIKTGISQVLTDLLFEFENRFIRGLIAQITGAQGGFSGAFSGLFSTGITTGSTVAAPSAGVGGATAGSAWASGFSAVAGPLVGAYIGWKLASAFANWIGGGGAPKGSQQEAWQTPGYGYAGNPNNPWFDPGNPDNPTAGDGGMLNMDPSGGMITPFAEGGIVTRPTRALIGEAGPEAVIPLSRLGGGGSGTVILEVEGRTLAELIVPFVPGVVRRYRLA